MIQGFQPTLNFKNFKDVKLNLEVGYFAYFEGNGIDELKFCDAYQKVYDISRVAFLTPEFDIDNGEKRLPKPYYIAEDGSIKEYGANVLYSYIDNFDANIVAFGSLTSLVMNNKDSKLNFDTKNYNSLIEKNIARNNDNRYYLVSEDGQGNLIITLKGKNNNGNITLLLKGDQSQANGNLILQLNGKLNLQQVDDKGNQIAQILLDNTSGSRIMNLQADKLMLQNNSGETLKKILVDLITAINTATWITPGGNVVSPPLNKATFDAIVTRLNEFMDLQ